jgi:glycerate kinase
MAIKLPKRKLVAEPGHAPRHIVVMMDTFKGSISSARAGQAVADGIGRVLPEAEVTVFPIADGGEGTVDAFLAVGGGSRRFITVHGALMEPVETSYAILSDGTACIEVASICGLTLVPTERRNPLDTTTLGVGEAIVDALNHGCRRILIGLGGSATNDVGMGALQALGYRFLDKEGAELGPGCGRLLKRIRQVDAEGLNPLVRETKFHLLCDVNNPLLGHYGAVQVFAPQKGADTPHKLRQLEEGVLHFHNITQPYTGINCSNQNFAGAAGGMAYGLRSYLGATAHNGFTFLMEYFPTLRRLGSTDLIITGEGKADRQTLMGKAPVGVLTEANMRNVPVILVAGSVADEEVLNEAGFRGIFSIIPAPMSLHQAMRPDTAEENIRRTVMQVMQTYCHTSGEVHDDNDTSI